MLPLAVPLPAPFYWDHLWATFTGLLAEGAVKPDFLLGEVATGGWWYYFPVALAVKTPLPLLIFLVAGLAALWRRHEWRRQVVLWLPPLLFLLLGLTGFLTIGYRHMLPGKWEEITADLAPWAGKPIVLSLGTDSEGPFNFDWAIWGEPRVETAR